MPEPRADMELIFLGVPRLNPRSLVCVFSPSTPVTIAILTFLGGGTVHLRPPLGSNHIVGIGMVTAAATRYWCGNDAAPLIGGESLTGTKY